MACPVTVSFSPPTLGTYNATLTITGPDPMGTRVVPLTGTGSLP